MPHINYLAVLVSGVVTFMLGGLWYSPLLFAKKWTALQERNMEEMAGGSMPVMYVQVFLCGLITAWVLAILLGFLPLWDMMRGIKLATICWLGFTGSHKLRNGIVLHEVEGALAYRHVIQSRFLHPRRGHSHRVEIAGRHSNEEVTTACCDLLIAAWL